MLHVPIATPALLYRNERARKPIRGGLTKKPMNFTDKEFMGSWKGWASFRVKGGIMRVPERTVYAAERNL